MNRLLEHIVNFFGRQKKLWIFCGLSGLLISNFCVAQNMQAANRKKIDRERLNLGSTEKEAFTYGREFVRLDSTYYVGWMYQGLFLQNRAEDRDGYQKAISPLKKAFVLLEKDFTGALKSVYRNTNLYGQYNLLYNDYVLTGQALKECYEYTDRPDSAIWILDQVQAKNFKRDEFGLFGSRAWIIHRNRFYTQKDFPFLKSTVAENETMALQACYTGFGFIKQNESQNLQWFGAYAGEADRLYIYHYLALIHSYMQRYDSSEYYYSRMAEMGSISWNNYGSLKLEEGEFAAAGQLYGLEQYDYFSDNRLREPFYYLPLLKVYAGQTKEAIRIASEAIQQSPSTPGFGWYNIALARAYLYNGQLDSADISLEKANNFKEVHIGTTLTQPQYEFTIKLLRLIWLKKKIQSIKFCHAGWWYQPKKLYEISALYIKVYSARYALVDILSQNPERDRILYDLFCGESTVGFDEIYSIMEDVNPGYFEQLMNAKSQSDKRLNVVRYFRLGKAKMLLKQGHKQEALLEVNRILSGQNANDSVEKLFKARALEIISQASSTANKVSATNQLLETYPQLIPFSGIEIKMGLQINGLQDANIKEIRDALNDSQVNFVSSTTPNIPVLSILFRKNGNKYEVTIDTRSASNQKIVENQGFLFTGSKGVAEEILLRAFGKSGAPEFDAVNL